MLLEKLINRWIFLMLIGVAPHLSAQEVRACDEPENSWQSKACWYVGVGLLQSHVKPDASATSWKVTDDDSNGYRILLGLNITDHVFAELDYSDLGEAGLNHRNSLIKNNESIDYKAPSFWSGYYLRGYKEGRDWDIYLKVGLSMISNKSSSELLPYDEQTSWQLALGAAGVYRISSHTDLRIEFTSYDEDARTLGIGITRRLEF